MTEFSARDLSVVIPTRGRWPILQRTLESLGGQTVSGFDVVVVVDGCDEQVPDLPGARLLRQPHRGPGAARNRGVDATERPLVLFLGDDMIPEPSLVASHLDGHRRDAEENVAVLGHVDWHPEVARNRVNRWLDWSGTQFDFHGFDGDEAGFGRFYSCNVSLKREFFVGAGGFDEDFTFYYEDLDCGWRLHQNGLRLKYAPDARALHLHAYDLERVRRRFHGIAVGECRMAAKHDWFDPYFRGRVHAAALRRPVSRMWPLFVDATPRRIRSVRRVAERRADRWYHQQVAPAFWTGWSGERELEELRAYLGDDFDEALLRGHRQAVDEEEERIGDEAEFYRRSQAYLYDLTAFAMSGTKEPYLTDLRRVAPKGARLLDWGCGIGSDGLRLLDAGYRVSFADFANPTTAYLRWRLDRRGLDADVFDLDTDDVPGGFDVAYALDVIEHVDDPFAFLGELERRADIVMVNFLEPDPDDTHLHRPLPVDRLLDHAAEHDLLRYRRYHGRSHLVVYRAERRARLSRVRAAVQRRAGSRLPGAPVAFAGTE